MGRAQFRCSRVQRQAQTLFRQPEGVRTSFPSRPRGRSFEGAVGLHLQCKTERGRGRHSGRQNFACSASVCFVNDAVVSAADLVRRPLMTKPSLSSSCVGMTCCPGSVSIIVRRLVLGHLAAEKDVHSLDLPKGKAACGSNCAPVG